MKFLIDLADYGPQNTAEDLVATCALVFVSLWLIELAAFCFCSLFSGPIFGPLRNRRILGRHTMDFLSMAAFSLMGLDALRQLGGFEAITSLRNAEGKLLSIGAERSYFYNAAAQRICLFQVAYEAKNFCDSVIHNDGVLFLVHHTVTGLLSAFGCFPVFHLYGIFFLGISEISTSVLCVLACFDAEHGVGPLGEAFPLLLKVLGVLFAVLFIIFRVVLWPWVSYYFFKDALNLYESGTAHSIPVVITFMVVNAALSLLQVVWLGEIITTAKKVLGGDGKLSIERGGKKDQ